MLREKIEIYDGKFNDIGEHYALTASWFRDKKRCNATSMANLSSAAYHYLYHTCHARSLTAMWTTLSTHKDRCVLKGYKKSYVPCNARATNDYCERKYLAYLLNRYYHPIVKQWFVQRGATLDDDKLALAEIIQWIWRSSIRNGEEIKVFIPSKRMRRIFTDWLNDNKDNEL